MNFRGIGSECITLSRLSYFHSTHDVTQGLDNRISNTFEQIKSCFVYSAQVFSNLSFAIIWGIKMALG
jgi:hypothetical protein